MKLTKLLIIKKEELAEATDKELVKYLFPIFLLGYRDAFLKAASDMLFPY